MNNSIYYSPQVKNTFSSFVQKDKGNQAYTYTLNPSKETLTQQQEEKSPSEKLLPKSLWALGTSATLLLGGLTIAILTGNSKNAVKPLKKLASKLERSSLKARSGKPHKVVSKITNGIDKATKVFTNITPIKDFTLFKLMQKTKLTKGIWDKVTKVYSNINKKATLKAQKNAIGSYNVFLTEVEKIIKHAEKNNPKIAAKNEFEKLKKSIKSAREESPDFFTEFEGRYEKVLDDTLFLQENLTLGKLFSKSAVKGFIPEDLLFKRRSNFVNELHNQKNIISYSHKDISKLVKKDLEKVNDAIYSIKDFKKHKKLRLATIQLEESLTSLEKANRETRTDRIRKVKESIQNIKQEVNTTPKGEAKDAIVTYLDSFDNMFNEFNKGKVQEIRELVGNTWGKNSKVDKKIKSAAKSFEQDLNKSLSSEIKMYDKERDIKLGSGPTDALGLLTPVALYTIAVNKAESKDEKVGITLKSGIPIVGGTTAYLQTLAWQFSGGHALLTSLGVATLLNFVGKSVYQKYQNFQEKKQLKEQQIQFNNLY